MAYVKKGLLFSALSVEIEDVSKRMKKPCADCGTTPKTRRLKVKKGGGKRARINVYCEQCAEKVLARMGREANRAIRYLAGEIDCVREEK